jgi:hypothetical protein
MKTRVIIYTIIIAITLFLFKLYAQDVNYKVHAMFMYHFTKYVEWPDNKKSGDFVIGVYGNSEIIKELESVASTKKAGTQTIVVKKIANEADAALCHIVYVSQGQSGSLETIIKAIGSKPVLLVTEKSGLSKKGACINFVIVDDKLRFEINKSAIESRNLKISSDLLKLGILV